MDWSEIVSVIFSVVVLGVILYLLKRRADRELGGSSWISWVVGIIGLGLMVLIFGGKALDKIL